MIWVILRYAYVAVSRRVAVSCCVLRIFFRPRLRNVLFIWVILRYAYIAVSTSVTGWRRLMGSLIFIGHFLQKWLIFSGSFVENDLQLRGSYDPSPPCTLCSGVLRIYLSAIDCGTRQWHGWFWGTHVLLHTHGLQCVAVCCSVLQCVAVWCSVLQCLCCGMCQSYGWFCGANVLYSTHVLQCVAVSVSCIYFPDVTCLVCYWYRWFWGTNPLHHTHVLQCVAVSWV